MHTITGIVLIFSEKIAFMPPMSTADMNHIKEEKNST
jgi:hypothetical protein